MDGSGRDGVDGWGGASAGRLPRRARAVVFDLDGTLLDTEGLYREAFAEALTSFDAAMASGDYDRLIGLSSPSRRAILPSMLGSHFPVSEFFTVYRRCRAARLAAGVRLKPGAVEALDLLDEMSLPCAVATSASAATALVNLAAAGLAGRFDAVLTRSDVARGKPAPDIYLAAAAALGTAPHQCLALEDSPPGIRAAWAARLMTVMVPDTLPATPAILHHCATLIGSLHDLPALLDAADGETGPPKDRSRLRV